MSKKYNKQERINYYKKMLGTTKLLIEAKEVELKSLKKMMSFALSRLDKISEESEEPNQDWDSDLAKELATLREDNN